MIARVPHSSVVIVATAIAIVSSTARADCDAPASPALDIYSPRDGGRDVPTNANLFAFAEGRMTFTLNGANVPVPENQFGFPMPDLEPNTEYVARFNVVSEGIVDALEDEITFTTGAGEREPPAPPVVGASELFSDDSHLPDPCRRALFRNQCFDTGPVRFRQFAVTQSAPIWRVSVDGYFTYLPGICAPEIVGEQVDEPGCVTVAAVAEDGTVAAGDPFCWGEPSEIRPPTGCAHVDGVPDSPPIWAVGLWLGVFAGVLRKRRTAHFVGNDAKR